MGSVSVTRYNGLAMALHWLIAALILTNIGLAWRFEDLHGLDKDALVQWHKSIGISVLLLSIVRLAWRVVRPPPRLPPDMGQGEQAIARLVHVAFYGVMIGMPLSGWALSSASPLIHIRPIVLFGVVPWPALGGLSHLPPGPMKAAHDAALGVHGLLAKLAYVLIVLHVGAALRHMVLLKDGVMGRMWPGPGR